jgi:FtsH-binding integral membrane protein
MAIILIGVIASGLLTSKLLHELGVDSMAVRYGLAAVVGYGLFFAGVRLWLWYAVRLSPLPPHADIEGFHEVAKEVVDVAGDIAKECAARDPRPAVGEALPISLPAEAPDPDGAGVDGGALDLLPDLDDSAGIVLAVGVAIAIVTALAGASVYLIVEAPAILGEAAFQAVLVVALERRARKAGAAGWTLGVFKSTWVAALVILAIVVVVGFVLDMVFPRTSTLFEILRSV